MLEKDFAILCNLYDSLLKILEFSSSFDSAVQFKADIRNFDATMMNFIVIGEMAGKLSDSFKEEFPDIPWRKINAFRNILAHDYFGIYEEEVWQIIQHDIPEFKLSIEEILM